MSITRRGFRAGGGGDTTMAAGFGATTGCVSAGVMSRALGTTESEAAEFEAAEFNTEGFTSAGGVSAECAPAAVVSLDPRSIDFGSAARGTIGLGCAETDG